MFYHYSQNNSFGRFEEPAIHVIIEASSHWEANGLAETKYGLYFHGVSDHRDCGCCGDRWYKIQDYDTPDLEPLVYGQKPEEYTKDPDNSHDLEKKLGFPVVIVYYLNGEVKKY